MKQVLLLVLSVFLVSAAYSQPDTTKVVRPADRLKGNEIQELSLQIYPVPVRDNIFNIRCSKEISSIKVTNIIGQDIFRADYENSQYLVRIILDNPQRGIYLVTVNFSDKTRIVGKIMIEEAF